MVPNCSIKIKYVAYFTAAKFLNSALSTAIIQKKEYVSVFTAMMIAS